MLETRPPSSHPAECMMKFVPDRKAGISVIIAS